MKSTFSVIFYLKIPAKGVGFHAPPLTKTFHPSDETVSSSLFIQVIQFILKKIAPIIRKAFRFDTDRLNLKSRDLVGQICSRLVVSIHIRRGDYLSEKNRQIYGDICPLIIIGRL